MVTRRRPDVVLAYCSGMARFALDEPLNDLPFVLDMVDVDSAKWANLAKQTSPPMRWVYSREARIMRQFEREAMKRARSTTAVNVREVDALREICPGATVHAVGNGVDVETFRPQGPPGEHPTVVFCGVMNYGPNEAAAIELARVIWPQVRAQFPTARLLLVGSSPTQAVRALSTADSSVEVTGQVADVRPYLWKSAVAAAPLRVARGVQNKVLEALAAGLPVVTTPVVEEGLPRDVLPGCHTEESSEAVAQAICGLLARSPEERRAIAARASLESLTWRAQLAPFYDILQTAAGRGESTPNARAAALTLPAR
jgi:polysaccharide biosynthesis protein PslH